MITNSPKHLTIFNIKFKAYGAHGDMDHTWTDYCAEDLENKKIYISIRDDMKLAEIRFNGVRFDCLLISFNNINELEIFLEEQFIYALDLPSVILNRAVANQKAKILK